MGNQLAQVYLHLGSNMGNRVDFLAKAKKQITERIGIIQIQSTVYETAAWGVENQPDFLNQAILVETEHQAFDLLDIIHQIEAALGRERHQKWHERTIDIDILFYDQQIIQSEKLTIPHAQIAKRNFVLVPMLEIAGDFVHPVLQVPIDVLYWKSKDKQEVWVFDSDYGGHADISMFSS